MVWYDMVNVDLYSAIITKVSNALCQCGVKGDTSRTSPLQGHLTVSKVTVTVCHTAEHYGEETTMTETSSCPSRRGAR